MRTLSINTTELDGDIYTILVTHIDAAMNTQPLTGPTLNRARCVFIYNGSHTPRVAGTVMCHIDICVTHIYNQL